MMNKFMDDAADLCSVIVNKWEADKNFNELVRLVADYLVDRDSDHDATLTILRERLLALGENVE